MINFMFIKISSLRASTVMGLSRSSSVGQPSCMAIASEELFQTSLISSDKPFGHGFTTHYISYELKDEAIALLSKNQGATLIIRYGHSPKTGDR